MKNTKNTMKKIAILTSGGDAPGMNTAIRAVAKSALSLNIEPILILEGYKGLCNSQFKTVPSIEFDKFISRGGTHIYSSRFPEFSNIDVQKQALKILKSQNIDGLVVIGGDGSYKGALALHKLGFKTIAIPGTIDNDIPFTETTIGFDSAINTVVETIDVIRNTAQSHNRLMLVETMGRDCPDITIFAGTATGAEAIITIHNIFTIKDFINAATKARKNGKRSIIFVISEFIYGLNGRPTLKEIAQAITDNTGIDARTLIVGHSQRGSTPSAMDRVWATKFGIHATKLLTEGKSGLAVANKGETLFEYKIDKIDDNKKRIQHKYLIDVVNKLNII